MKNRRMRILEALLLVTLLSAVLFPSNILAMRRTSYINAIINNLRQIDGAKQQWAIEKRLTGAVKVTPEDLAPYLKGGWVQPVAREKYILTTTEQEPHALLTRKVEGYPVGTLVKLPDGHSDWIVLPSNTYRDDEAAIARKRLLLVSVAGVFAICASAFLVKRFIG